MGAADDRASDVQQPMLQRVHVVAAAMATAPSSAAIAARVSGANGFGGALATGGGAMGARRRHRLGRRFLGRAARRRRAAFGGRGDEAMKARLLEAAQRHAEPLADVGPMRRLMDQGCDLEAAWK